VSLAALGRVVDFGFLALLEVWAQLDVWAPQITAPNHMVGDKPVLSAAALAAGLGLLGRSRWPLATTAVVLGSLLIPMLLYGSSLGLGWFLLIGLALYSVGAHAELRPAIAGLALYGVWSVILVVRAPLPQSTEAVVLDLIYCAFLVPAWVIGIVVRNPRLRAVEWERRATRLERERLQAERTAVAKERSLISRELHDIVAHSVSLIVLQAEAGDSRLDGDTRAAHQAFHAIEESARQALGELRRMLGLIRTSDSMSELLPQPRLASVPHLIEDVQQAGLQVTLEVNGEQVPLPPGLELNAYRIIQEALTNSLKHGHATSGRVCISYVPAALELEIVDNGHNLGSEDGFTGQGLIGMRERVLLHGGQLVVAPQDPQGFRVWARLPVQSSP